MAVLTDKEQPLARTIGLTGMATDRTGLAGVVGIDLDGHRRVQEGFVGNHALQFCKGPFGVSGIGFSLLLTRFLAFASFGAFTDICQVLQADQAVGVLLHDAFRDDMIGVLRSPVSLVH
jgi:hypothetical protein